MNPNALYIEITLKENLDERWQEWFHGLALTPLGRDLAQGAELRPGEAPSQGQTRLSGCLRDQAALHGVLERIRDLNLHLVSVQVFDRTPEDPGR